MTWKMRAILWHGKTKGRDDKKNENESTLQPFGLAKGPQ